MITFEDIKSGKLTGLIKEAVQGETVENSKIVYNIMKPLVTTHEDVEKLYCIFLDSKNAVLSIDVLASGTLNSAAVYTREVIKKVINSKAAAVIVVHNHPSGDINPSAEDKYITKKIFIALKSIDVILHEHVIIGKGYYSFADKGIIEDIHKNCKDIFK
jgi:DNA repair protein RadC